MSKPQNGEPGSPAGVPAADDPEVMFQVPGPTVSFSRLHYSVMESNGLCHKRGTEKHILKDVSGIMRPGMNAIMGPTGSGKTSLLDVIAGRKDPAGLKFGQVLVDAKMVDSDLRLISAYVVQAVTINEFKGQIFYNNTTILPGEVYLETQGIDCSTWGFWQNHVALGGIITVCMVLAYIQLRQINRWK
ncbi:broad substrate specificity ATP-binding cassette transporter ABCG2 isoform X1 [Salmo salar]|uniref:Broad substrate specificity ATP-binding cassette transporter ABCG2 isoform X1 n=1 Tax=Salmo salar TaxID=8030 RepID=A0ABM3CIT4_SALSA|nr:broad substrate specificity ATP-binding cassette transporter ABCG2-like isoform X1 [Salmo salar]